MFRFRQILVEAIERFSRLTIQSEFRWMLASTPSTLLSPAQIPSGRSSSVICEPYWSLTIMAQETFWCTPKFWEREIHSSVWQSVRGIDIFSPRNDLSIPFLQQLSRKRPNEVLEVNQLWRKKRRSRLVKSTRYVTKNNLIHSSERSSKSNCAVASCG